MAASGLRIGELAKRVGLATSALRYYEEAGLLGPARRSEAGYRLYGPEAVGRVEFVQRAKALGLTLAEIRRLTASPAGDRREEAGQVRHLVAHKLAETRRRLGELRALEGELEQLYVRLLRAPAPDCGHLGDCACWLPTEEEVKTMREEVRASAAADCGCCDDPDCGCCCGGGGGS